MAGQLADQETDTGPRAAVAGDTVAVVLSFNARDSLRVVLTNLAAQTVAPARTIVVDNGSHDDTAEMVAAEFPQFALVTMGENAGVGAGHRKGWEMAFTDDACRFVWVLEHDTFAEPDCLERLVSEGRRLVADGMRLGALNSRAERDRDEARTATISSEPSIERRGRITFNAILLTREAVEAVGWPRADFFVGHEDWDYAERLRQAGFKVRIVERAVTLHPTKGNRRHGVVPSVARTYYSLRNGIYVDCAVRGERFAALRWIGWTIGSLGVTLVRHDRKRARACARLVALFDGITGRLGRRNYWFLRA